MALRPEQTADLFKVVDPKGSGLVSRAEFSSLLGKIVDLDDRGVELLLALSGLDGRDGIRYKEFFSWLYGRLPLQQTVSYYGAYRGDRFDGGIGWRVGIDESAPCTIQGTGVARICLISESHEKLRRWATVENWRKATEIHKAAYFTRTENLVQEAVLERIRQHYVSEKWKCHAQGTLVQAALFRLTDREVFRKLRQTTLLTQLPMVAYGMYNERVEECIVDFANKRLGGGWLSYGMVQEEKLFTERFSYGAMCARSLLEMPSPVEDPLASKFSMHPEEAWILRGGAAFARVNWYGYTPMDALDKLQLLDPTADVETAPTVVAMDAIKADFKRYDRKHLKMMLVKAFVGFCAAKRDPEMGNINRIATGSWGCGAFKNNERVMFCIQTLAANLAGTQLVHHVLSDERSSRLNQAFSFLEDCMVNRRSIQQAFDELVRICSSMPEWSTKFEEPIDTSERS